MKTDLTQEPFGVHEFGVEDCRACRAANGVVAERDELPVEYGTGTEPADEGGHAAIALGVLARLRTVGLRHVLHGMLRGARETTLLRNAGKGFEGVAEVVRSGVRGEFDRHGYRV